MPFWKSKPPMDDEGRDNDLVNEPPEGEQTGTVHRMQVFDNTGLPSHKQICHCQLNRDH